MEQLLDFFIDAYRQAPTWQIVLEAIAFFLGIASVIYAKKVNILVYPTGLISTVITVYLLYVAGYFGDMMMNVYYSAMSIYGWWNWARMKGDRPLVPVSRTNARERKIGFMMFLITMVVTYGVYRLADYDLQLENYIDVVTSGIFFTAMWFMANKKIEHWMLWIIADLVTVPLYAYRGLGMLSLQYLIFTILAFQGLIAWRKALSNNTQTA